MIPNRAKLQQDQTRTEGDEQRLTDQSRIRETGMQTRENTRVTGDETRKTDTNRITVTGDETRKTDTNRINTQGDDNRKTMDFGNRLEARTRADQSRYSRNMARSF